MERQSHYTSGKKIFLGPKILGKSYLLSNFLEIFHITKQILHTGKKKQIKFTVCENSADANKPQR